MSLCIWMKVIKIADKFILPIIRIYSWFFSTSNSSYGDWAHILASHKGPRELSFFTTRDTEVFLFTTRDIQVFLFATKDTEIFFFTIRDRPRHEVGRHKGQAIRGRQAWDQRGISDKRYVGDVRRYVCTVRRHVIIWSSLIPFVFLRQTNFFCLLSFFFSTNIANYLIVKSRCSSQYLKIRLA